VPRGDFFLFERAIETRKGEIFSQQPAPFTMSDSQQHAAGGSDRRDQDDEMVATERDLVSTLHTRVLTQN
jgi:hypothetical protein